MISSFGGSGIEQHQASGTHPPKSSRAGIAAAAIVLFVAFLLLALFWEGIIELPSEDNDNPPPDGDPVGTVTSNLRYDNAPYLDFESGIVGGSGGIAMDGNLNFLAPDKMVDVGQVSGLSQITYAPISGLVGSCAIIIGQGYVVHTSEANGYVYKVRTVNWITSADVLTHGGIIGVTIRWCLFGYDDSVDIEYPPSSTDPVGTVTKHIRYDTTPFVDLENEEVVFKSNSPLVYDLSMDSNLSFQAEFPVGPGISDVGQVSGLLQITAAPTSGWVDTSPITTGHGYVVKTAMGHYYGVYPIEWLTSPSCPINGGKIGIVFKFVALQSTFQALTVPTAPQNATATIIDNVYNTANISISWEAPSNDGGCPILYYIVTLPTISVDPILGLTEDAIVLSNSTSFVDYIPRTVIARPPVSVLLVYYVTAVNYMGSSPISETSVTIMW